MIWLLTTSVCDVPAWKQYYRKQQSSLQSVRANASKNPGVLTVPATSTGWEKKRRKKTDTAVPVPVGNLTVPNHCRLGEKQTLTVPYKYRKPALVLVLRKACVIADTVSTPGKNNTWVLGHNSAGISSWSEYLRRMYCIKHGCTRRRSFLYLWGCRWRTCACLGRSTAPPSPAQRVVAPVYWFPLPSKVFDTRCLTYIFYWFITH